MKQSDARYTTKTLASFLKVSQSTIMNRKKKLKIDGVIDQEKFEALKNDLKINPPISGVRSITSYKELEAKNNALARDIILLKGTNERLNQKLDETTKEISSYKDQIIALQSKQLSIKELELDFKWDLNKLELENKALVHELNTIKQSTSKDVKHLTQLLDQEKDKVAIFQNTAKKSKFKRN